MSNQYYNFYYDPTANGFDPLSWRSLYGTPAIVGTRLSVGNSTIIHLAQMLRGDFVFNLLLPAPSVGDDRQIGLVQYNKDEYAYFRIQDDALTAETSDGVTAYSTPITWQSEWSGVGIDFRIKWEAGAVKFYINNTLQATISYSTLLDIPVSVVPSDSLSFYISDYGSASPILLNYIEAKEIQSYLLLTSNSSVIVGDQIEELDRLTITEAITMAPATEEPVSTIQSITLTDVPTIGTPA
jgi:hypothetical protein